MSIVVFLFAAAVVRPVLGLNGLSSAFSARQEIGSGPWQYRGAPQARRKEFPWQDHRQVSVAIPAGGALEASPLVLEERYPAFVAGAPLQEAPGAWDGEPLDHRQAWHRALDHRQQRVALAQMAETDFPVEKPDPRWRRRDLEQVSASSRPTEVEGQRYHADERYTAEERDPRRRLALEQMAASTLAAEVDRQRYHPEERYSTEERDPRRRLALQPSTMPAEVELQQYHAAYDRYTSEQRNPPPPGAPDQVFAPALLAEVRETDGMASIAAGQAAALAQDAAAVSEVSAPALRAQVQQTAQMALTLASEASAISQELQRLNSALSAPPQPQQAVSFAQAELFDSRAALYNVRRPGVQLVDLAPPIVTTTAAAPGTTLNATAAGANTEHPSFGSWLVDWIVPIVIWVIVMIFVCLCCSFMYFKMFVTSSAREPDRVRGAPLNVPGARVAGPG